MLQEVLHHFTDSCIRSVDYGDFYICFMYRDIASVEQTEAEVGSIWINVDLQTRIN